MEVYDTITLPNGGIIQMDQLAYETFQGICSSNYKGEWTVTLDFKDGIIETASVRPTNNVMLGTSHVSNIELR